jgi:hypothetical protein
MSTIKIELTKREADMVLDALNRMECDDIWDQYSMADERALDTAQKKVGAAISKHDGR